MRSKNQTNRLWLMSACVLALGLLACGCSSSGGAWTELIPANGLEGWNSTSGNNHTWTQAASVSLNTADEGKTFTIEPGTGIFVNGPDGRTADLVSEIEHGDIEAHYEFCVTKGSNSGVYFMGKYEIQIYDSFGESEPDCHHCGGIYERWKDGKGYEGRGPRVNASKPAGQWQKFDVIFKAPKFDDAGKKIANAEFVKVVHNGKVIHENEVLSGPTRGSMGGDAEIAMGPLRLQGDHGPVAYRNIRIRPLK